MEADLALYYRIDLTDLFTGRLSWRRLWVLVQHLPADSAVLAATRPAAFAAQAEEPPPKRDPDSERWSRTQMLLAQLIDYIAAGFGIQTPPVPRPGIAPAAPPVSDEGAEFLFKLVYGGE